MHGIAASAASAAFVALELAHPTSILGRHIGSPLSAPTKACYQPLHALNKASTPTWMALCPGYHARS